MENHIKRIIKFIIKMKKKCPANFIKNKNYLKKSDDYFLSADMRQNDLAQGPVSFVGEVEGGHKTPKK
jgi:hypothetical protein